MNSFITAQVDRRENGNLVMENIPELSSDIREKLSRYQNTRAAFLADWSQDGESILITTRFGETSQFHLVNQPGGQRRQITFYDEPVSGGAFCPAAHQNGILFLKDIGGSEFYQLFYLDLKNNKTKMLTEDEARNSMGLWSNFGDRFIYASTRRNKTDYDLYIHRRDYRFEDELIFEGKGYWNPVDWSADDRYVTISNYKSIINSHLYILDIKSGSINSVRESDDTIAYGGGYWNEAGDGLFLVSDFNSEFRNLKYYDIQTKAFINLTKSIPWDVEDLAMAPDRKHLAFTINDAGTNSLYIMDVESLKYQKAPGLPTGIVSRLRWHPQSKLLALTIETATSPADVYVLNTVSYRLNRWTFSEVGGLDSTQFVAPKLIHYPTFDKVGDTVRKIPAFYYKPANHIGPHPVLIYIHGGPEGQFQPDFSATYQYFLNELGIAIIAPNVRGSAGYGKSYVKLDNGFKREDSVKDIGALLDWIDNEPALDASSVAVAGGSYGGYMVLASMIHFGERIKCGVDIVGISNFVTFLKNTQSYRRDLRRAEYGDERDPTMRQHLEAISPSNNAGKITQPIFIAQGLNDPRVPASEAEQMLKAIRDKGGTAWYMLAKDEGHGFRKKFNRDYFTAAMMMFFQKHLLETK